jgi:hypothetical protein
MFACLSIIGCSCGEGTTSIPYFPVQNEPEAIQMQVRIEGRLILDEGYLRLKPILHESYIIIWPYGYTVRLEDSTVQVIDADGQVVACVGDWIVLGGGETDSAEAVERSIGQSLPSDCTGPYWIAGVVVE